MMSRSSKELCKILMVIVGVMSGFGGLSIDMQGGCLSKVEDGFG